MRGEQFPLVESGVRAELNYEEALAYIASLQTRGWRLGLDRMEELVRRAGLYALRQSLDVQQVAMSHFEQALVDTRASVTPEMEKEYESIEANLKQNALTLNPIGFIAPGMLTPREKQE